MSSFLLIAYRQGQANPVLTGNLYYRLPDQTTGGPAVETNVHFLGKFTAPKYNVLPALRQHQDETSAGPAVKTNTHFIGRFAQPKFSVLPLLRQYQDYTTAGPAVETNVHFIGRFRQAAFNVLPLLRQQSDFSSTQPKQEGGSSVAVVVFEQPQANPTIVSRLFYQHRSDSTSPIVETNVNFLGKFTAPQYNVLRGLRENQDRSSSGPAIETNTHFIGRFSQPKHNVLLSLRSLQDTTAPVIVQPETNVHFIAKFKPPTHAVLQALRQQPDVSVSGTPLAPQEGGSSILVVPFEQPQANPVLVAALNYWKTAQDTSSVPVIQPETNVHFVGRFHQPQFNVLQSLRQQPDISISGQPLAPQEGGSGVFVVPFEQPQANPAIVSALNYWKTAQDTSSSPGIQPETNTHFVPKFREPSHNVLTSLWQQAGGPIPLVIETNVHFIGKFTQPQFNVLRSLREQPDVSASGVQPPAQEGGSSVLVVPYEQPQANPALVAALNYRTSAQDTSGPPPVAQPETNTNFIPKFTEPTHNVLTSLWTGADIPAPTVETNTHFIPRYAPVIHRVLPQLRQNIAADFSSSAVPTNVHFIGRYRQPAHSILPLLRMNTAQDFSSHPPPPPKFTVVVGIDGISAGVAAGREGGIQG